MVRDALKERRKSALDELEKLIQDRKAFPINYNHYYIDTIRQKRQDRIKAHMEKYIPTNAPESTQKCSEGAHHPRVDIKDKLARAVRHWADTATSDMETYSCEEALDCLLAIYKVGGTPCLVYNLWLYLLTVPLTGPTKDVHRQRRDSSHRTPRSS